MDWDDLRLAFAVIRHGSLSAAARALGTTQPTVSRRLEAFEKRIGATLFERGAKGLTPNPLCTELVEGLEHMEGAALAIERRIAARDTCLQGRIAVTSLDWLGDYVVAPIAARFGALHPLVELEIINEGRVFNLARGDADIAFRFGTFAQENLVERRVAEVGFGLYASREYLERRGSPDFEDGCSGHFVATLHRAGGKPADVEWLQALAPNAHTVLRANSIGAQLAAAEAGEALGVLPRVLADSRHMLRRIETPVPAPVRAVRMGVHAELRNTPRIRAFIDFTVSQLESRAAALNPG